MRKKNVQSHSLDRYGWLAYPIQCTIMRYISRTEIEKDKANHASENSSVFAECISMKLRTLLGHIISLPDHYFEGSSQHLQHCSR